MRITLRWGKNRDPLFIALLGRGRLRALHFDRLRDYTEKLHPGAGPLWAVLLRYVCGGRLCGWLGDVADPAIVFSEQTSVLCRI